ncbi:hypothetical protein GCM10009789_51650 [Kribbella sancticallisti]|uniref:TadE-like domain-containing protein n=1 Tax=Kribbella sancticallisti TaxID=460087 RepID=A0ABP4PU82_9ACTN
MRFRSTKPNEAGAVTAEVAIVLPMLLAVVLLAVWAVGAVITNLRCIDAARDTARAVARGEPPAAARRIGERSAPPDAAIKISPEGEDIHVVVTATIDWPLLDVLPSFATTANATVQVEPGTLDAG